MTERRLQKLGRAWQKKLRLQDWHIQVVCGVTEKGKDGEYCMGWCEASPLRKTATITILDSSLWPKRTPGYRGRDKEIELTLIHELLHCHFQFKKLPKAWSADDLILENGIESLAIAFFGST